MGELENLAAVSPYLGGSGWEVLIGLSWQGWSRIGGWTGGWSAKASFEPQAIPFLRGSDWLREWQVWF